MPLILFQPLLPLLLLLLIFLLLLPLLLPGLEPNPEGIVSFSPGLRACELPWETKQRTALPQWGCGRARHRPPRPRRGSLVLKRRRLSGLSVFAFASILLLSGYSASAIPLPLR